MEWRRISRSLRELELFCEFDAASGVQRGESLWGTPSCGALVAVGWKWSEVDTDVVAIDNPMSISSNVVLLDELGQELSPSKRILHLNNAVYRLGWQSRVIARAGRGRRALAV
jgi:hypothetical protein